ncbi:MAG: hypothetical protein GY861_29235 [bacterium]|nr:hypothetical protein [bacterium]
MSKYIETLQGWNDETVSMAKDIQYKVGEILEPISERFKTESLNNIPQVFGEFLYSALGDRVTGQRSSKLNMTLFEKDSKCKGIATVATHNGTTIEEELVADYKANGRYYDNTHTSINRNIQAYITAGRKFGISYLTGNGDRVHTMYYSAGSCFKFLTQEHVDCIKNKAKRKMTQDFLDFRDEMSASIDSINNKLIPVDIPIKHGIISNINTRNKYDTGYKPESENNFLVIDSVLESKITHLMIDTIDLNVWDKVEYLNSYDLKRETNNTPSYISMTFLNINDANAVVTILGNVDLDMDGILTGIDHVADPYNTKPTNRTDARRNHNRITDEGALKNYIQYGYCQAKGFIMNMNEVLTDDIVSAKLNEAVDCFNNISFKLQEVKRNNVDMYFLNGDM